MKSIPFLLLILFTAATISCDQKTSNNALEEKSVAQQREFYQLKIYTMDTEEQVRVTDTYLKEAYMPGIKKLGVTKVGVFKPRLTEVDTIKKIYVLVPYSSLEHLIASEDDLSKDESYLAAGSEYINAAHDKPPYKRMESIVLKAFEEMPIMQTPALDGPRSSRIYELRSYESPTEAYYKNKVDMFNAGGEVRLFNRLVFNAVFYGEVISGSKMPNLMYMTTFSDQESRDEHWKAFGDASEWKELIAMPKYDNNVSHADIIFLYPTDYSDY